MEVVLTDETASNPAEEVAPEDTEETAEVAETAETAEDEGTDGAVDDEADEAPSEDGETDEESEDEEGDGDEVEEIELNFGGDKLRVPKGAIPEEVVEKVSEFSRNLEAGYTRKFQEVSERAKSVEAREAAVEKIQSLNNETLDTYSRGLQIKQELAQLSQIDLNAMWQSDPDQARRISDAKSRLESEFQNVVSTVNQQEQQLTQAQREERGRRIEEGKQQVAKRVPDFSENDLKDYALKAGIPEKDFDDWALNPVVTEAFWKAMKFDRMQTKAKPAKPAPAKPVKSMKGKGGKGQKSIADMSMEEYVAHRQKGEA